MIDWLLVLLASLAGAPDPGCATLAVLDHRRAAALAQDDPAALLDVYPPGSPLLTADDSLLRAYRDRGLRLHGARVERLACRTTSAPEGRRVLAVVDRVGPATVTGGGAERALPRDRPTRREVVLVRTVEGWRVSAVR